MSSSENPYQPPTQPPLKPGVPPVVAQPMEVGLWRKDHLLVMHKSAELPAICVKSGQPAKRRLRRSLSWHHPAIFLTILISVLVYVILALVLRKTATIHIGLSDRWFAIRRRAIIVGWICALAGIGVFVLGIAYAEQADWIVGLIPGGLVLFFFGLIYGLVRARMVVPTRINDQYIWLKGVNPSLLAELPPWPQHP